MAIAKILVPVCGHASDAAAIATAFAAAKPFGAHVAVLSVHEDPALAVPLVGVPLPAQTIEAIMDGQTQAATDAARRSRAAMIALCESMDVAAVAAPTFGEGANCAFVQDWGDVAVTIGNRAALSDLVVLGPMGWGNDQAFNTAFLDVLRDVRRPVLVAHGRPKGGFARIAIAWDDGAAAANAVYAAMDFLRAARSVSVIAVAPQGEEAAPTGALETYLMRHGVACTVHRRACARGREAENLLDAARAQEADLLVAGAYGHDHLREALIGGATETLAAMAAMPVLLAH